MSFNASHLMELFQTRLIGQTMSASTTITGGYFHGMPCGRTRAFDHFDQELDKQLFAVTTI